MLHFHLLFKFLNKIKSGYLEESSVEREVELEGGDHARGFPGRPRGM